MSPFLAVPFALAASAIASQDAPKPRIELLGRVASVTDTNIERNKEATPSNGTVLGLSARYRSSEQDPRWTVDYDLAAHQYSNSEEFDRVSHRLQVVYTRELSKPLELEVAAEASVKGSTEDRDLSNQLSLQPELSVRLNRSDKLKLKLALRKRESPDDRRRNSDNVYGQVAWQHRFDPDRRLEIGFRYEVNRAQSARNHYVRWGYKIGYEARVSPRTKLEAEFWYRPRLHTHRLVDDGPNRMDKAYSLEFAARHRMNPRTELTFSWRFESRTSNDPDKGFGAHTVQVGANFRF